ncbi:torso-like protein [Lycorma delicatula]|uniref:torso-like protein n=1 Tax=Lycorma delicatula TaxID=130591 RepID=UPI003F5131DD
MVAQHIMKTVIILFIIIVQTWLTTGEVRCGGAINLFGRFGYLSISMRVVPRNDTDHTWIFREPIVDVFKQVTIRQSLPRQSTNAVSKPIFQGDFHMEFCDNIQQLLQAYFRDFTIERLDEPWRAFTASWSPNIIARNLGIESNFVVGEHCYVLVRVARHHEAVSIPEKITPEKIQLQDAVAKQVNDVKVGDENSVGEFIRSFGSHYVTSYITGNSLYQVFVYTPAIYKRLKEKLKTNGVASLSPGELTSYFSPWYAEHIGKILTASGNTTMEQWAIDKLRVHFYFFSYASLLKIHGDTELLKELDRLLGNEALLELNLRALSSAFKDKYKRQWFNEVIDNYIQLWEVNM